MSNSDDPPVAGDDEDQKDPGITRSEHARLRSTQGRPIAEAINDVQKAGPNDVFIQPEDQRFVVRGPKGREHIIDATGELVTSVRRTKATCQVRLKKGIIRPATAEEYHKLKTFVS